MYTDLRSNKLSRLPSLAIVLGLAASTLAGHSYGAGHEGGAHGNKYVEFSQIGDPAEVLEVKEDVSRPLDSGELECRCWLRLYTPLICFRFPGTMALQQFYRLLQAARA